MRKIKDPFVLEFLRLKDEYFESELEEALIRELEQFLLELGNDSAFVARQNGFGLGPNGTGLIYSSFIAGLEPLSWN